MKRTALRSVSTACVASLIVLAPATAEEAPKPPAPKPPPQIFATVNGKGVVTLKNKRGQVLKSIRRGRYTVTVQDLSKSDVFRINGPGVNKTTSRKFVGAAIWGVQLRVGTYTIRGLSSKSVRRITVTR